jgi:hypothetical protein
MASYRQLSTGRFEILHMIERKLPLAVYTAEWKALGEGKDPEKYRQLTTAEKRVPLIFTGLYFCVIALYLLLFTLPYAV